MREVFVGHRNPYRLNTGLIWLQGAGGPKYREYPYGAGITTPPGRGCGYASTYEPCPTCGETREVVVNVDSAGALSESWRPHECGRRKKREQFADAKRERAKAVRQAAMRQRVVELPRFRPPCRKGWWIMCGREPAQIRPQSIWRLWDEVRDTLSDHGLPFDEPVRILVNGTIRYIITPEGGIRLPRIPKMPSLPGRT